MKRLALLLAGGALAYAQQYSITTVAGGAPPATPSTAASTAIGVPHRVTVGPGGNVYFSAGNSVFRLGGNGALTLVAGNGRAGYSGDNGPAVNAQLDTPRGVAFDAAGNLYIADSQNNRVRMVDTAGIIHTFAGAGDNVFGGGPRSFGDGGPATQAFLKLPQAVAVDGNGNVFIADTGDNMIRKVTPDSIITGFAGDSYPGFFDKGDGTAADSEFNKPGGLAIDSSGNVFVADTTNNVVRKIAADGSTVTTFAGTGATRSTGDNGPADKATMTAPIALTFDSSGNLYIAVNGDQVIRKVDSKGNITTVAGDGKAGFTDGDVTKAEFNSPTGIAVDSSGNIYVADSSNLRIRKIASNTVSSVAGNGALSYGGDGGPAIAAQLNGPRGVAVDGQGNFYIADTGNNVVRKVGTDGVITNLVGNGQAGSGSQLNAPLGIAADSSGNVYVADSLNSRVLKVANGSVSTVGGADQFYTPSGVAVDAQGNVYVADVNRNVVRKIAANGSVTTVAGSGNGGFGGDGGPAASAMLNNPRAVAVDAAGNIYIADSGNNRVRIVTPNGNIATLAGNGLPGYTGDGSYATLAQIGSPLGVAADAAGNVYFTDGTRVRRIFASSGLIATIAGGGPAGYSGDGGVASNAQFRSPTALAIGPAGIYVADTGNDAIRLLTPMAGGLTIGAVTNGATNQTGAIAPGEIIVVYGSGMGPEQLAQAQFNSGGQLPTSLAGTQVFVNGTAAPILYTSATQVSAIAPFSLAGSKADVVVSYRNQLSPASSVGVAPSAPAIFTMSGTGSGQAVAVNADGTINDANHPAHAGSYVLLYATGGGQMSPPVQDGSRIGTPLPQVTLPATATIGGADAKVEYTGGAPGFVAGLLQVNVDIPSGVTPGAAEVVLKIGDNSSPKGVTIQVSK